MQFNLFFLATTFLVMLSQFGCVTDACSDGWTQLGRYCVQAFDSPVTLRGYDWALSCSRMGAAMFRAANPEAKAWIKSVEADDRSDFVKRYVCSKTLDGRQSYYIKP